MGHEIIKKKKGDLTRRSMKLNSQKEVWDAH